MALIDNTARVPEVSDDFHTLEVEGVDLIDGIKFGTQDVPEVRVQMQLRVRTPGEPDETFNAFMSTSLGDKATLGAIARAILGQYPTSPRSTPRASSAGASSTWSATTNVGGQS